MLWKSLTDSIRWSPKARPNVDQILSLPAHFDRSRPRVAHRIFLADRLRLISDRVEWEAIVHPLASLLPEASLLGLVVTLTVGSFNRYH